MNKSTDTVELRVARRVKADRGVWAEGMTFRAHPVEAAFLVQHGYAERTDGTPAPARTTKRGSSVEGIEFRRGG